jgi:glycerol kinase
MHAVASCGITNQRETTILWNRKTGRPIYNAIVWQDRRTSAQCEELKEQGYEERIGQKTGLLLDPYFSATKIAWVLDHVDGAREMARNGDILFGTVDCFLLWHLTGARVHATDPTNAARTMLYNIRDQGWDGDLLAIFGVPENILPRVRDNESNFGQIEIEGIGQKITVGGIAGDQRAGVRTSRYDQIDLWHRMFCTSQYW